MEFHVELLKFRSRQLIYLKSDNKFILNNIDIQLNVLKINPQFTEIYLRSLYFLQKVHMLDYNGKCIKSYCHNSIIKNCNFYHYFYNKNF